MRTTASASTSARGAGVLLAQRGSCFAEVLARASGGLAPASTSKETGVVTPPGAKAGAPPSGATRRAPLQTTHIVVSTQVGQPTCRQAPRAPEGDLLSGRSLPANGRVDRAAPTSSLRAGRPVLDRALRRRVDLLGRDQHHRLDRRRTGGVDRERGGGCALVVGKVEDHVRVAVAEGEVEALERAADALGDLRHGVTPAAAALALDALDAGLRVRDLD